MSIGILYVRDQWMDCFKGGIFNMNINTNNRLESLNSKVNGVCSKYVSLSTSFDQFLSVLSWLRNEWDHSTLMALAKKKVVTFPPD